MSLDRGALDLVRDALAASPAFQAFSGSADAAAAQGQIVWIDGPCDVGRGHALLGAPRVRLESTGAIGRARGMVSVPVELVWPDPGTGSDADRWAAFLDALAAVRRALVLDDPRWAGIEDDGESLRLDPSDEPSAGFTAGLVVVLRGTP